MEIYFPIEYVLVNGEIVIEKKRIYWSNTKNSKTIGKNNFKYSL